METNKCHKISKTNKVTRYGNVHWSEELFMLMVRSVANVKSG